MTHAIEKNKIIEVGTEYNHFLKLDAEKQERILSVAYDEFILHGYNGTSTNEIVQKAGISKGLLFRYFGSKEGLYKFLMIESMQCLADEIVTAFPNKDGDVFGIIKNILRYKIEVCLRHPREADFLVNMWQSNLPDGLSKVCKTLTEQSYDYYDIVCGMIDKTLLQDDVTKEQAAEIVAWVSEKYSDKVLKNRELGADEENWRRIAEGLDSYLDALKFGLYK